MNEAAYDVLVYLSRLWFVALTAFLVYRAALSCVRERRIALDIREQIDESDAFAMLSMSPRPVRRGITMRLTTRRAAAEYPIRQECLLGSGRDCDICLKDKKMQKRHLRLLPAEGALRVIPLQGAVVLLAGEAVKGEALARHGDELRIGDLRMTIRLGGGFHR